MKCRLGLISLFLLLAGCKPEVSDSPIRYRTDLPNLNLPTTPFNYTPQLPSFFTDVNHPRYAGHYDNMPATNITTDVGATLGRVLFYDKRLSANNTVSCASCHQQEKAFSDDAHRSEGFQGGLTRRHSMGLTNARFYLNGKFFWDERANTLEGQVLKPIQDPVEMGMDLVTLTGLLASTDEYPVLFSEAFGTPDITSEKISHALAQFVRSMISYQTKFDQGVDSNWDNFNNDELEGAFLFASACAKCHQGTLQSGKGAANNGIDFESSLDLGIAEVTGLVDDEGKFKIPSLRNVALTAPYMHDGRFTTIEEVIDFYSTGVLSSPSISPLMHHVNNGGIRLTPQEKADLLSFIHTLRDDEFMTNPKFGKPEKFPDE